MAVDEFVAQGVGHVRKVERALLLAELRVEDDMQQQVAQLLADALHVVVRNGVGQFVGLFDGIAAQRVEGLLAVPRTLAAERVHHLQQPCHGFQAFVFHSAD